MPKPRKVELSANLATVVKEVQDVRNILDVLREHSDGSSVALRAFHRAELALWRAVGRLLNEGEPR